jgi:hypothetical protein
VAESGLYAHADLQRMARAGARAFLVGESLMREADVASATRRLLGLEAAACLLVLIRFGFRCPERFHHVPGYKFIIHIFTSG